MMNLGEGYAPPEVALDKRTPGLTPRRDGRSRGWTRP